MVQTIRQIESQAVTSTGHCHNSSVDTVAYVMVGLICLGKGRGRLEQGCCLSVSCYSTDML